MQKTYNSSKWKSICLGPDRTVREAIQNLNDSSLRIVLVTTTDYKLLGTISDGDIRRALLKGLTLNDNLEEVMQPQPIALPATSDELTLQKCMRENSLQQIPIINSSNTVVGLTVWSNSEVPQQLPNQVVIMAGGRGTRLMPHTNDRPKPMVEVDGKPMLEHIINRLKGNGFSKITLAVHHLSQQIEDYFGDGKRWDISISYIHEERPLGTAGALGLLQEEPKQPFIVTNADLLTQVRYSRLLDYHIQNEALATMTVKEFEWQNPFGVVELEGARIVGLTEKPINRWQVNAGVYVLSPEILKLIPPNTSLSMPELFMKVIEKSGRVLAFPIHEAWLDVGNPEDLKVAHNANP